MTRHRTLIVTTIAATLLATLALAPAANAEHEHEGEYLLPELVFNTYAPSGGSNYQFLPGSSCAHGNPCIFVARYGSLEYTFRPTFKADFYDYMVSGNSGTNCDYVVEVDIFGIPAFFPAGGSCPDWDEPSALARLDAPMFAYGQVGESVLRIACPGQPCTWQLDHLGIRPGFHRLDITALEFTPWMDLAPLRTPSDLSMESCLTVRATGSYHYPIDYFRVTWGDGDETFDTFSIPWPERSVEKRYCHAYPPSVLDYQLCVTAHDGLDRLHRECIDVDGAVGMP